MTTSTSITLAGLRKRIGTATIVDDLSLAVPAGAFLVLLGPSGCGKTTTLRMIAGLEAASSGRILIGDRVVSEPGRNVHIASGKRGLGMVFQHYALWPHMSVRQNIEWPLRVAGWRAPERHARVAEVLELVELTGLDDRRPAELSGGQQQRVAIARTLAPRPSVLLFDEPLSNLDARLRQEMRSELVRVHHASGATSVYVTHDQSEALAMATHIAVMRAGRLEQCGTPETLLEAPATAFVAEFLGTPPSILIPSADGRLAAYLPHTVGLAAADGGALDVEVLESSPLAGRTLSSVALRGKRMQIITDRPFPAARARLVLPETPNAVFAAEQRA